MIHKQSRGLGILPQILTEKPASSHLDTTHPYQTIWAAPVTKFFSTALLSDGTSHSRIEKKLKILQAYCRVLELPLRQSLHALWRNCFELRIKMFKIVKSQMELHFLDSNDLNSHIRFLATFELVCNLLYPSKRIHVGIVLLRQESPCRNTRQQNARSNPYHACSPFS